MTDHQAVTEEFNLPNGDTISSGKVHSAGDPRIG
jgi:hypothetical protein